MPRRLPLTVIGTPLMLCSSMIWRAVPTVSSGGSVIGSTMMPFSLRLTLSTSRVCCSIDMFLWMMPMPPSWARAMASSLSVTVSIGEETIGMLSRMLRVSCVRTSTSLGQDLAVARLEQDIVEGDALVGDAVLHGLPPRGDFEPLYGCRPLARLAAFTTLAMAGPRPLS